MDYVRAWQEPDYPHGDWISQDEWMASGVDELFDYVEASEEADIDGVYEGFFALYSENDMGSERIIPLEYSSGTFSTVSGVFDSNPGVTQRYTSWNADYSFEGLMDDVDAMDGKIVELEEDQAEIFAENFSSRGEAVEAYEAVMAAVTGFFS
ncbi:hypothetical protein ACK3SF_03030 [Candidatus Nanosalina sp. VS9-1]|uniref:hypothetical protein n=1 Tax=Candidatus Nanosalina sp. VS9-1 TaxID=3388566 RepID=UPI0039DFE86A